MTLLQHIICPCGIIRAIIILIVAGTFFYPTQSLFFPAASRLEAFLFIAILLDILSRTAGIITELSEEKNKEGTTDLREKTLRIIRGLFLSNYGGLVLVPIWFGCLAFYLFSEL